MLLIIAAMALTPEDEIRAEGWARKAKPFAECVEEAACNRMWDAAKKWVAEHSRFKIVVDQPLLYSTPGAIYANTDLSFTLTRRAKGEGAVLSVHAWCGNVITCHPKPKDAVASLKRAVEIEGR